CASPPRLQYAELDELSRAKDSFPVGSQVSFICRPGYIRIPGKPMTLTCGDDLQWFPTDKFCTERKCKHPGELENGLIHVADLTFGSKATFSCREGYRLQGNDEVSCVIKNEGVDWSGPLPFCEIIPCGPPPSIANGHYTERANYVYQSSVIYRCEDVPRGRDPFSLIGIDTIFCTSDADSNGVWSGPPPECRVVKCENPRVENGRKISGFGPSYSYKNSVRFECDPGYFIVGADVITCEEDNTWVPPKPTCEKSETFYVCPAPKITNGALVPAKAGYREGESVQVRCNAHCSFPDGTAEKTVTCQGQSSWGPLQDCSCQPEGSGSTPVISYGRVTAGQKPSYSVGDVITFECYTGYILHGEAQIQYIGNNQWAPGVPTCQLNFFFFLILPKVIVAVVVLLAAFWIYKKFLSQNG
ncbi:C4BPA protein, partial [Menura novaehollandiae]|nr:C4BPA protein [Menura novaehollandiae]